MKKRTFDFLVALLGLILCLPLFVLISVFIKLESAGPIFFKQVRMGRGFQRFKLIKFRTMVKEVPKKGRLLTIGEDPRITRVGRVLRRFKLDELPQLLNILKGEMSFVGPRPEVEKYVEIFRHDYEVILTVPPGLTDLASLKFFNESAILGESENPEEEYIRNILPEKIRLASVYIKRSSFLFDLALMFETIFRLFGFKTSLVVIAGEKGTKKPQSGHVFPLSDYTTSRDSIGRSKSSFNSGRYLIALKVGYDVIFGAMAMALAFLTHFVIAYWNNLYSGNVSELASFYIESFYRNVFLFVFFWISTLTVLGIYRTYTKTRKRWKPLKVLFGVFFTPLVWSLLGSLPWLGNIISFPNGVAPLVLVYLAVLIGGPRILKHFILDRMVIEIHHHRREKVKNVLVIGGGGYIGSQVSRDLLDRGYKVRILDSFLFGDFSIQTIFSHKGLEIVVGDFRNVETVLQSMRGMDAVVHLGGLVGDPACALDDDQTLEINITATMMLAEICKVLEIERFIFASSCSVYGAGGNKILTEKSTLEPVSLYARTKIASEMILLDKASEEFSPIILRFGTLFGLSPRPRFDLIVNLLTAQALKEGRIDIYGGSQWRPFVHVRDVSRTVLAVLEAPKEKIKNQIFNVGSNVNNFRIRDVGQKIASYVPGTQIVEKHEVGDRRDYKVSFNKLSEVLGVGIETSIEEGIQEIRNALVTGIIDEYTDAKYSNFKQTQHVLDYFNGKGKGKNRSAGLTKSPLRHTVKSILDDVSPQGGRNRRGKNKGFSPK